ncbi:MAG TPA: hypothetical protein VH061_00110 [Solirubrobacteraceae bacterium]|jgi:hypothetical protein|nr:hypothetical protein [Solirubrobacteraceae bacterium]
MADKADDGEAPTKDEAPAKTPPKNGASSQLISWAKTALPAVSSAIGISGFISVLGAGILWIRFSAANIPAEQAIGDLPKSSLLVTGVVTLVLYLALGLLAVLAVYLTQAAVLNRLLGDEADKQKRDKEKKQDKKGGADGVRPAESAVVDPLTALKRERKLAHARIAELEATIEPLAAQEAKEKTAAGTERLALLKAERERLAKDTDVLDERLFEWKTDKAKGHYAPRGTLGLIAIVAVEFILVIVHTELKGGVKALLCVAVIIAACLAAIVSRRSAKAQAHTWRALWKALRTDKTLQRVAIGLGLVAVVLLADVLFESSWILLPCAVSLVLGLVNWAIGRLHPSRFFWYGLAVFTGVPLFGAALTYSRTFHEPSAQGSAVLLKNGCVVRGLWVGESSTRVFLARVTITNPSAAERARTAKAAAKKSKPGESPKRELTRRIAGDGYIFWIPRPRIESESVGRLRPLIAAAEESDALAEEAFLLAKTIYPGAKECRTKNEVASALEVPPREVVKPGPRVKDSPKGGGEHGPPANTTSTGSSTATSPNAPSTTTVTVTTAATPPAKPSPPTGGGPPRKPRKRCHHQHRSWRPR